MNIRKLLPAITLIILIASLFVAGCDTLVTEQVEKKIVGFPIADFGIETGSTDSGCIPLTVVFADLTKGPKDRFIWSYGDGVVDTFFDSVSAPTHVYDSAGTYMVSLKITDSETGGEGFEQKTRFVIAGQSLVGFTADTLIGCIGTEVTFTKQSGGDNSWAWNFGDGNTSTEANPTHTYTQPGLYTVSLTVQGACGSDSHTIEDMISIPICSSANMMVIGDSSCTPATVTFNDSTQIDATQVIVARLWTFGDGATSVGQDVTHTYDTAGVFDITLKVTTDDGGVDIDSSILNIFDPVAANFAAVTPTAACLSSIQQFLVKFEDQSDGVILSRNWDFGDGFISTDSVPIHAYTTPGFYSVELAIVGLCDGDTAWDTTSVTDLVVLSDQLLNGTLAFTIAPDTGTTANPFIFTDLSTGVITAWNWDFGDATPALDTGSVVDHTYTAVGDYLVSLTLINTCDTVTITDSVFVR